jgi:hypothetical protein
MEDAFSDYDVGLRDGRAELIRELLPALRDLLDNLCDGEAVVAGTIFTSGFTCRLPADVRAALETEKG